MEQAGKERGDGARVGAGAEVRSSRASFLALGDSYTVGESVPPARSWPCQLVGSLRTAGYRVDDPFVVARTGWTTDELAAGIRERGLSGPFGLVSLLIGVNNQYRGRTSEDYGREFRGLLDQAVGLAGGEPERVLVLSIPDWGVMPFAEGRDRGAIGSEIDGFNEVNRKLAGQKGCRYADITPISREARESTRLVAADGLHPSGDQYGRWVEEILPVVRKILAGSRKSGDGAP